MIRRAPKTPPIRWYRDAESRLFGKQYGLIRKDYGIKAADNANYGWGVDVQHNRVVVCTKVYLPAGAVILQSDAVYHHRDAHSWRDY